MNTFTVAYAVFITGVCIVLAAQIWVMHRRRKQILIKLEEATRQTTNNGRVVQMPRVHQR